MIDKTFVEKIAALALEGKATEFITDENGHKVLVRTGGATKFEHIPTPEVEPIVVRTLSALIEYVRHATLEKQVHIVVSNWDMVSVMGEVRHDGSRAEYLRCVPANQVNVDSRVHEFRSVDDVTLHLLSEYADFGQRNDLLSMLANISSSVIGKAVDDGFSQAVEVKKSAVTFEKVTVRNPVTLKRLRGFPEVHGGVEGQLYTLRFSTDGADVTKMKIVLTESDGGQWKVDQVLAIKKHLVSEIDGERAGVVIVA